MVLEHAPVLDAGSEPSVKFDGDSTDAQTWMAFLEGVDSAESLILLATMLETLANELKTVSVMAADPKRPKLTATGLSQLADVVARICRLNQMPVYEMLESAGQPFTRCATPTTVLLQQARALNDHFNAIRRQRGQEPIEGLRLAPLDPNMAPEKLRKPKKK